MSEAMIARWRAIPLDRPAGSGEGLASGDKPSLKRSAPSSDPVSPHLGASGSHAEGEEGVDDDDVSLLSRSPSPRPRAKRGATPETYEEDESGYGYEKMSVHTPIGSSNVGHALLLKMGWQAGQGLGPAGEGRKEPVPFIMKSDSLGLGKLTQELRIAQTTVEKRRELESERLLRETAAQREARENNVAKQQAVQQEVKQQIRQFYCELCGKQYANVAQYDEHLRSYSHTHKQRMKEVQEQQRKAGSADIDARREKERKREERELKKMAAAAGIRLPSSAPKAPAPAGSPAPTPPPPPPPEVPEEQPAKKGWKTFAATVTAPAPGPPPTAAAGGGFKKGGWAMVGSSPGSAAAAAAPGPRSGFTPSGPAPLLAASAETATSFQSGGYTTLDTSVPTMPAPPGSSSHDRTTRTPWAPIRSEPSTLASTRPPSPPGAPPPQPEPSPPAPPPSSETRGSWAASARPGRPRSPARPSAVDGRSASPSGYLSRDARDREYWREARGRGHEYAPHSPTYRPSPYDSSAGAVSGERGRRGRQRQRERQSEDSAADGREHRADLERDPGGDRPGWVEHARGGRRERWDAYGRRGGWGR